jgi:ABC-type polysaccharide/polyol phosphate transport system ATPase subunit
MSVAQEVIVSVEHLSKKFCRDLKKSLWYGIRDIAAEALVSRKAKTELRQQEFWAVEDASFELRRGETLGLIGPNGAGKTTLLKMINGLIKPDNGKITVRGRVGALIQLGAGFHPLLTGRENIYISGAILGMSKREIDGKLNDIIEFSGIEEFIDAPVRNYSSGMFVRLGFSVAVHVDPDLLLIDEVLAVGDAEFRSRSMERMWKLVNSGKTAIIFVSHNMIAVNGICDRVILLDRGVVHQGRKSELIAKYYGDDVRMRFQGIDPVFREQLLSHAHILKEKQSGEIEILSVQITDGEGQDKEIFHSSETLRVRVNYLAKRPLDKVISSVWICDPSGLVLCVERSNFHGAPYFTFEDNGVIEIQFDTVQLKAGKYILGLAFHDPSHHGVYSMTLDNTFRVVEDMPNPAGKEGFFKPNLRWVFDGCTYSNKKKAHPS